MKYIVTQPIEMNDYRMIPEGVVLEWIAGTLRGINPYTHRRVVIDESMIPELLGEWLEEETHD